jgi:hypothetical protein
MVNINIKFTYKENWIILFSNKITIQFVFVIKYQNKFFVDLIQNLIFG